MVKIRDLIKSGLSLIPIKLGSKAPAVNSWSKYMETPMSIEEWGSYPNHNVAAIGGDVSGGLEILDFDNHFGDADSIFQEFYNHVDLSEFPIAKTPSGGYHVYFRSDFCEGNKKLARRINDKNRPEALIETRGNGGYALIHPSENYEMISGDMLNIPKLTKEQRDNLINTCKVFDEYHGNNQNDRKTQENSFELRVGDEYNESPGAKDDAIRSLRSAGWNSSNGIHWIRPDKQKNTGISATFGKVAPNMFYVFSSNAYPFESEQGYLPFAIRTILEFGGDYSKCIEDLKGRGFGRKSQAIRDNIRNAVSGKNGLTKNEVVNLAIDNQISVDVAKKIVDDEISRIAIHDINDGDNKKKKKIPPIITARNFVYENYDIRFNTVLQCYDFKEKHQKEFKEFNPIEVVYLAGQNGITLSDKVIGDVITIDEIRVDYDPFKEYFESVKHRDPTDAIDRLCKYFTLSENEDPDFFKAMLRKALVRQVKCAIETSYYNRMIFTIISPEQKIGKSFFIRWLNPFKDNAYYTEALLSGNKDDKIAMTKNFIYNLEEVDNLGKYGISQLKAVISTSVVNERAPYAKQATTMHRRCTFWASTNSNQFLEDVSNTRWLTFQIESIDRDYSKDISIHNIWAEAYQLYLSGYDCELTEKEKVLRDQSNESVREVSVTEDLVKKYLIKSSDNLMRATDIYAEIKKRHETVDNSFNTKTLGKTLAFMGFEKVRKASGVFWNCDFNANENIN